VSETRVVTGTIIRASGSPWADASVLFTRSDTYTVDETHPADTVTVTTDEQGEFSATLTSGLAVTWRCDLPDKTHFYFTLPEGAATTIEALRIAASSLPSSLPTVQDYIDEHASLVAAADALGHVMIGSGLSIDGDGVLSADGAALSDELPEALGAVAAGASEEASRSDHVHAMPSAANVGADPTGTALGLITAHEAAANPHPAYLTQAEGDGLYSALGHVHDERYYTEAEIDALFAARPSGSGAAGLISYWSGANALTSDADLVWDATNNRLGVGTPSPAASVDITLTGSGTSGASTNFILSRNTTNTPAATFGTSWLVRLKSTTTDSQTAGIFETSWIDPTHASRASLIRFGTVRSGGTLAYPLEVSGGSNQASIITRLGWSGQTNDIQRWNNANDSLTYASISNIGQLTLKPVDAVTNALTTVATLGHNSSGTPAPNFGGAIIGQLASSTTADQDAARISWYWSTATHATRSSALAFATVSSAGALTDRLIVDANGITGNMAFIATQGYVVRYNQTIEWKNASVQTAALTPDNVLTASGATVTFTGAAFGIQRSSADTAVASNVLMIRHNTSGTPAANFGARQLWQLKSDTTADQSAAADDTEWTTATHATRTAQRRGYLAKSGTLTEAWRYDHLDSSTQTNAWLLFNNVLTRVLVGAADSGGAGYRLLRVTN
jgi:hypothetical protein